MKFETRNIISDVGECASQPTLEVPKAADFLFVILCSTVTARVAQRWTFGNSGNGCPHVCSVCPKSYNVGTYSDFRLNAILKAPARGGGAFSPPASFSAWRAEVKLTAIANSPENTGLESKIGEQLKYNGS